MSNSSATRSAVSIVRSVAPVSSCTFSPHTCAPIASRIASSRDVDPRPSRPTLTGKASIARRPRSSTHADPRPTPHIGPASWPMTVVTPDEISASNTRGLSVCTCVSMPPGVAISPSPSMTDGARADHDVDVVGRVGVAGLADAADAALADADARDPHPVDGVEHDDVGDEHVARLARRERLEPHAVATGLGEADAQLLAGVRHALGDPQAQPGVAEHDDVALRAARTRGSRARSPPWPTRRMAAATAPPPRSTRRRPARRRRRRGSRTRAAPRARASRTSGSSSGPSTSPVLPMTTRSPVMGGTGSSTDSPGRIHTVSPVGIAGRMPNAAARSSRSRGFTSARWMCDVSPMAVVASLTTCRTAVDAGRGLAAASGVSVPARRTGP